MGLENLSVGARSALLEVGRMAYGSREGAAGGKGHIGLLKAKKDGCSRIIKFDTHGGSTGGAQAAQSGDALRDLLKTISESAGLPKSTLKEIRKELGLSENVDQKAEQPNAAFERTVAAKVVELIGGKEIWREVKASFNKDVYKSKWDTSFDSVYAQAQQAGGNTNNAKAIEEVQIDVEATLKGCFDEMEKILTDRPLTSLENAGVDLEDIKPLLSDDVMKAVSKGDLERAFLKMFGTAVTVNCGNADVGKLMRDINSSPKWGDRRRLTFADLQGMQKNAQLVDWCGKNAEKFGFEANKLKTEVMKQLFKQDLHNDAADTTEITEKITVDGNTVEVKGTRSGIDALKVALGQPKTAREKAREGIKMFVALAAENGNRADFYLKRSEDGKGLTSAGSRNIFRGSTSRDENNAVREWLKQNLVTYYGSEGQIPARVRQEMTNFEGGGHPLSGERVDKIWRAMEVDRVLSMTTEEFLDDSEAASILADNGCSFIFPEEYRPYFQDNHVDLSNKVVGDKLEQERRFVQDFRLPLNVGEVLTELQLKTDILDPHTLWAKDMKRYSAFKIGDKIIEGSKYYNSRVKYYNSKHEAYKETKISSQDRATRDTCALVADALTDFVSHGRFKKLDDLQASDDVKTKKLLLFVMSHMSQGMLNMIENPALSDFEFNRDTHMQKNICEMSFDEDGRIIFKQRNVARFDELHNSFQSELVFNIPCDPQKSRYDKSVMIMYSRDQLDTILDADFNTYAKTYQEVDPQKRGFSDGEKETYGDDAGLLVRGRAKALSEKIDPRMNFHPEVKMNYVITAIENNQVEET